MLCKSVDVSLNCNRLYCSFLVLGQFLTLPKITYMQFNKLTSVASDLLLMMNFIKTYITYNIVKVAVDPREDYFDNVMTKFIVYNRTDA